MKTTFFISLGCIAILFYSCKKDISSNVLSDSNSSSAHPNELVKLPRLVQSSTTQTQFIANADGNGTANITYNFAAKQPGISIVSFTFLAYETNSSDALFITTPIGSPSFKPTTNYPLAKAIATIVYNSKDPDGLSIPLPDDGSSIPITFTIHFNVPSSTGNVKSGDTVSIKLISIEGIFKSDPDPGFFQNFSLPSSPEIMLTGSKPFLGLNIYDPDQLHVGLTRIFETEYDSQGGSLGINNLPLVITTTGDVKFKKELIVKDENNNTINVTTIKKGNNYTLQFPAGYNLNGVNVHDFFVYAQVNAIKGNASINTSLQPPSKFSWTDIAGGRTTPYTIENSTYYYNYPKGLVTVTQLIQ